MKKVWIAGIIAVLLATISFAMAFLVDSNEKVNLFHTGENRSELSEVFSLPDKVEAGDVVKKEVRVGAGAMDCYVRVYLAVSDSAFNGVFDMQLNTQDWKKASDGYYYYKKVLPAGGKTSPLLKSLTFTQALKNPEDLQVICYSETAQAEGFNTPEAAFAALK